MRVSSKEEIIKKLQLEPLQDEGGYFRRTYADASSSAIYYLVTPNDFSALHRLKGNEVFHFYAGNPVDMVQFGSDGVLKKITLGSDFMNGMEPQVVVPAGTWQGTRLHDGGEWALLGTTMAPRFEYEDFELGDRSTLILQFPYLSDVIKAFTR